MPEPSGERLREILTAMSQRRVGVMGDVMLDRYVWGKVSRISPEAPVPVVDITEETSRLGGAANVAKNIVSLGGACEIFSVVGDDEFGTILRSAISAQGIGTCGLLPDPARPTTVKTRVIAHQQQVVRTDREIKEEITGQVEDRLLEAITGALERCDAVIISDYGKGVITRRLLDEFIPQARSLGRVVTVDPKETHFMNYRGVSLITPNQFEAGAAVGRRIADEADLMEVGWNILDKLKADALLITRGEDGMSLFRKDRSYRHFPTVARRVYDVTGAGDTVITSFTLALAAGAGMDEAAHISNHAAGVVIREVGTASVTPEQLTASFLDEEPSDPAG
jgi:D-beta-D-heptose 7-phosphate kinase/D-beta-D-heptose 1-phosphate adenosyltransferase